MITIVDEDIETVGDNIIPISPLDSLSEELLNETIDTQLKNPYLASTNCVAEYITSSAPAASGSSFFWYRTSSNTSLLF